MDEENICLILLIGMIVFDVVYWIACVLINEPTLLWAELIWITITFVIAIAYGDLVNPLINDYC